MKGFLSASSRNESLDDIKFSAATASRSKADFLLWDRTIVAELKALQLGSARRRVEERLRVRFAKRDVPFAWGTFKLSPIIDGLEDSAEIYALLHDLNSRALRKRLKEANRQIGAIQTALPLTESSGMMILLNDKEPMTTAQDVASAIHRSLTDPSDLFPNVKFVWALVETHLITLPDSSLGFPMFVAWKGTTTKAEQAALTALLGGWIEYMSAEACELPNDIEAMAPVYPNGPPRIAPFRP